MSAALAALFIALSISSVWAQAAPTPPAEAAVLATEGSAPAVVSGEDINMGGDDVPRLPVADQDQEPIIKSLFFMPEEMIAIRMAIRNYKKRLGMLGVAPDDEDYLAKLAGMKDDTPQARYFTYPQFFLESLVYHSPQDWVIWVNNQKITQDNARANTDIKVQKIDENSVTLEWRPVAMDRVMEVWQRAPTEGVTVNKVEGIVTFSLHTNQTFSSYVMRVLEGKVIPVTIDVNLSPVAVPAGQEGAGTVDKKGLGGLIDAYKKVGTAP